MTCPVCFKSHEEGKGECEMCKVCLGNTHTVPESSLLELARSKQAADAMLRFEVDRLETINMRLSESLYYLNQAHNGFIKAWKDGTLAPYKEKQ